MKVKILFLLLMLLFVLPLANAQDEAEAMDTTAAVDSIVPPAPPTNLKVVDKPNDHGHAFVLTWDLSADDGGGMNTVGQYDIYRWESNSEITLDQLRDTLDVIQRMIDNNIQSIDTAGALFQIYLKYQGLDRTGTFDKRNELNGLIEERVAQLPGDYKNYPENGEWVFVKKLPSMTSTMEDIGGKEVNAKDFIPDFADMYYYVKATNLVDTGFSQTEPYGPVQSSGQWYHTGRSPVLVAVIIFGILTIVFVQIAQKGSDLYVRPLGGIEAVDDAIGRATEMGRPILYVLGLGTAADVATIASFTILGRVAKRVAEYQTELIVPTYDPIVMTVAQEVVKSAYLDAGRPDSYKEDTVYFVTQSQFAYVAAVNGTMLRELPATNVYMGKFFAESLLLAETGALAGSIQISGTDEIAQIPFFIVACDYTLIGEELYAASAYLGREPKLLGSLKAQDYSKALFIIFSILGLLAAHVDSLVWFTKLFKVAD